MAPCQLALQLLVKPKLFGLALRRRPGLSLPQTALCCPMPFRPSEVRRALNAHSEESFEVTERLLSALPALLIDLQQSLSFEGSEGGVIAVVATVGLVVARLVAGLAEVILGSGLRLVGQLTRTASLSQPKDIPALEQFLELSQVIAEEKHFRTGMLGVLGEEALSLCRVLLFLEVMFETGLGVFLR